MKNNEKHLWLALCELGDYFSRLGDSARYFNMPESDIPLYVCCRLAENYIPDFEKEVYIDTRFLESAKPVIDNANKHVDVVTANQEDIVQIIKDFAAIADSKLQNDVSFRWKNFLEWINSK